MFLTLNELFLLVNPNSSTTKGYSEETFKRLMRNSRDNRRFFHRPPSMAPNLMPKNQRMVSYSIVPNVKGGNQSLMLTTTASVYKNIAPKVSSSSAPIATNVEVTSSREVAQAGKELSTTLDSTVNNHIIMPETLNCNSVSTTHKPASNICDILSLAAEQTGLTSSSSVTQNNFSLNNESIESIPSISTILSPHGSAEDHFDSKQSQSSHNTNDGPTDITTLLSVNVNKVTNEAPSIITAPEIHSTPSETPTNTTAALQSTSSLNAVPDMSLQYNWNEDSITGLSSQLEALSNKLENDVTLNSLAKSSSQMNLPCSPPPVLLTSFDKDILESSPLKTDAVGINMKSSDVPVHPWLINTASRDGLGLNSLLNTPQKVFPSDNE